MFLRICWQFETLLFSMFLTVTCPTLELTWQTFVLLSILLKVCLEMVLFVCLIDQISPYIIKTGAILQPIKLPIWNTSFQLQGISRLFLALPSCLAVLLIPRMHNPYKLNLDIKVTNKAFQQHKVQNHLVLFKRRKGSTRIMFPYLFWWVHLYRQLNRLKFKTTWFHILRMNLCFHIIIKLQNG